MSTSPEQVTRLLDSWRRGDEAAREDLFPLVYDELRRMANRHMARERPDHTLQATALVHEAYLRLAGPGDPGSANRIQFMALASQVMRHILVDHARSRRTAKRGGGAAKLPLDEAIHISAEPAEDLVELDEALERLADVDARKARIIELRFFGGLSVEEVANLLDLSTATIVKETRAARAWLFSVLAQYEDPGPRESL